MGERKESEVSRSWVQLTDHYVHVYWSAYIRYECIELRVCMCLLYTATAIWGRGGAKKQGVRSE